MADRIDDVDVEFVSFLGRGATSTVWRARVDRPGVPAEVAVKLLDSTGPDAADAAARLRNEARLLARLADPHLVRVYGAVRVHGQQASLMELVEGCDLAALLTAGPVPARAALSIVAGVAAGLEAAWSSPDPNGKPLRLVHRDVKPSNVLLTADGVVKIADFGVARADLTREMRTRTAIQVGTLRYLAPERWLGGEPTPAVDIFSLGLCLAEMLGGAAGSRVPLVPAEHAAWSERLCADGASPIRQLVAEMVQLEAVTRPAAAEVAGRARALAVEAPGPALETWAGELVPALAEARRQEIRESERGLFDPAGGPALGSPAFQTEPAFPVTRPTGRLPVAFALVAVGVAALWAAQPTVPTSFSARPPPARALLPAPPAAAAEPVVEPSVAPESPPPRADRLPEVATLEVPGDDGSARQVPVAEVLLVRAEGARATIWTAGEVLRPPATLAQVARDLPRDGAGARVGHRGLRAAPRRVVDRAHAGRPGPDRRLPDEVPATGACGEGIDP